MASQREWDQWIVDMLEMVYLERLLNPTEHVIVFFGCRCVIRSDKPGHHFHFCPNHPDNRLRWSVFVPVGCPDYHCLTLALVEWESCCKEIGRVNGWHEF